MFDQTPRRRPARPPRSVLGVALQPFSIRADQEYPRPLLNRDGCAATPPRVISCPHTVCVVVTASFRGLLQWRMKRPHHTPIRNPASPASSAGDSWCLCASRWKDALAAGLRRRSCSSPPSGHAARGAARQLKKSPSGFNYQPSCWGVASSSRSKGQPAGRCMRPIGAVSNVATSIASSSKSRSRQQRDLAQYAAAVSGTKDVSRAHRGVTEKGRRPLARRRRVKTSAESLANVPTPPARPVQYSSPIQGG